ncbi:WD repeat-containing protein 53, partial [Durusdinium trenchii]
MAIQRSQLKGHKDSVLTLCADGDRLASGGADGSCRLWDLRCTPRRSVRAALLKDEVSAVAISPTRLELLLAAVGGKVLGFDLRSEKVLLQEPSGERDLARDEINQISIDHAGHLCAVAEDAGPVHLLDLNTWRVDKTLAGKAGHDNICSCVAWKPGRDWTLASGGLDAAVVFWQRSGRGRKVLMQQDLGEESATATGPQLLNPPFVHSLAYLPDETLAAG